MKINRKTIVRVPNKGADMSVSDADGVFIALIPLPAGRYRLGDYMDEVPPGAVVTLDRSVKVIKSIKWVSSQKANGRYQSGANPDFVVSSADREARKLELTLNRINAASDRAERMAKALALVERIPQAPPAAVAVEVIDPAVDVQP